MDFELTEEQAALREVSRGMLAVSCPPQLVRSLAGAGKDVDDKLWQRGAELGWTGLAVPEEHDGAGQGLVELCLVAEEIGRAAAPGRVRGQRADRARPRPARGKPELVAALAAGDLKASLACHGPVAGCYDADELVLSGRATAVQAAAAADWLLVTAASDQGRRLVLVERARAAVEPRRTLDETRRWYDVVLDGLRVRAADVVSADEAEIRWLTDAAAVLSAADSLGAGERLLEMTVGYVKVREQFGRPLGSFQSVKHKVADMLTTLKGARAATYYAAMALDAGVADGDRGGQRRQGVHRRGRRRAGRGGAADPRRHRLHLGARPAPVPAAGEGQRDAVRCARGALRAARRADGVSFLGRRGS